tara:strand:+ start:110 stop:1360 length:1251 start_codon:yes stop_codon:yes gene_type:complete
MANELKLENPLSSDKKPVKINNESTGLLLEDNKVIVENELTVDGEAVVQDLKVNNNLKISANADDYATLSVADTGDLTIATTGDGTTDSDITLHADGNIILTADSGFVGVSVSDPDEAFEVSGNIKFTSDGNQLRAADGNSLLREASQILYLGNGGTTTTYIYGNTGMGVTDPDAKLEIFSTSTQLKLSHNANDYATFAVADTGDLTIATVGDGTRDSDLILDADGAVTLDSASGAFIAKNDDTQFSVANSAYAGMILGYTTVGIDASDDSYTLTSTMTVLDNALKVKFVAPPSGVVEIFAQIYFDASRRAPVLGLSDANSLDGYSAIDFPNSDDVTNEHLQAVPPSALGDSMLHPRWVVTGLTAGTAYEWWLGAKTSLGSGGVLRWGGVATNKYPPFIMKATALPAATPNYAVYG